MSAHAVGSIPTARSGLQSGHRRRRTPRSVRRTRSLAALFVMLVAALILLFPRVVHTEAHSNVVLAEHTVAAGDTLWGIAAKHAGRRDVREVISEIERANGLQSPEIHPGQVLVIPAMGR